MPSAAPAGAIGSQPLLETQSLSKSFGSVEALNDVSLVVAAGKVHTLLGENGAGKSTLMKILAGVHPPSGGRIFLNGAETVFAGPGDARRKGIAIVYQELSLANNLSVAENIYANRQPGRFGIVDHRQLIARTRKLLEDLDISLEPETLVSDLSIAGRQLVEIAKALSHASRVVIMDEPTSSLGHKETNILFGVLERLRAQGKAVVYISHRMDEIMRISDDISVMRDGCLLRTVRKQDTTINELISWMVGREIRDIYPPRRVSPSLERKPLLEIKNLRPCGWPEAASFSVRGGEVLGVFGLIGAGRSEIMKALFGIGRASGEIRIDGKLVRLRCPSDAIAHGMVYVPEDRKEEGLVLGQSLAHNINMVNFRHSGARFGFIDTAAEERMTWDAVKRLRIKLASPEQPVGNLSGGNQQKILFAKWLNVQPRIFLLDEPSRGIDVAARYEIYTLIRDFAASGAAIVLVSSDLPEALSMSDRLLVMRERRFVKEFDTAGLTQEQVMSYATGAISA